MNTSINGRLSQIGLDRLVRLKWLEQTASLMLAGNDEAAIKAALQSNLKDSFQCDNPNVIRGSIDKTITILLKVWVRTPAELLPLRGMGLELLKRLPQSERLTVHWGMVMATYPFWVNVALQVGRLLRLQGSAAAAHIQRRVCEQYGERETVSRRVRYVLRSFVDWEVLKETDSPGIYTAGRSVVIEDSQLNAWLIESFLHSRSSGAAPLEEVIDNPGLFPFQLIKTMHAESLLTLTKNLDVLRHGLDQELVMLRSTCSS